MNKVVAVLKDVLFVDSGDPWNPNPANVSKVMKMLEGIHKVLKQDGVYISISFGQVNLALIFCSSHLFYDIFLLMRGMYLLSHTSAGNFLIPQILLGQWNTTNSEIAFITSFTFSRRFV